VISAALSTRSPFLSPHEERQKGEENRQRWAQKCGVSSDHISAGPLPSCHHRHCFQHYFQLNLTLCSSCASAPIHTRRILLPGLPIRSRRNFKPFVPGTT